MRLGQEWGQTRMVDNWFLEDPAQVTIGTKNTQNNTDTTFGNNFDKEECGVIVDDKGDYYQDKGGEIVNNLSTSSPTQVIINANNTHNTTDKPFNNNCCQVKGVYIVDDKVDDDQEKV